MTGQERSRRRRSVTTVLLVLAVATGSFAAASWGLSRFADGGEDDVVRVRFAAPRLPERSLTAPRSEGSVASALRLASALPGEIGRVRAACLQQQGRDELDRALRQRRQPARPELTQPLTVLPIEFGPSSSAEARRFGFAGTAVALDEGEVGAVVSRDPVYDRLAERCDGWMYERARGLQEAQASASRFSEVVDGAFHDELVRLLDDAIERRLDCVRVRYPALPSWSALQQMNEDELLARLRIVPGRVLRGGGLAPSERLVPVGRVRVFAPLGRDRYRPSAAEVRFATAFADCARRTGFERALAAATPRAVVSIETRFGVRADRLRRDVTALLARLQVRARP